MYQNVIAILDDLLIQVKKAMIDHQRISISGAINYYLSETLFIEPHIFIKNQNVGLLIEMTDYAIFQYLKNVKNSPPN